MNRAALIARLSHHVHPPVLDALPTDWMRQVVAALDAPQSGPAVDFLQAIGGAFQLPGESGGHSVYRLTFADGSAYVGMTGRDILNRIEEHFGAGERDRQHCNSRAGRSRSSANRSAHVRALAR